MTNPLHAINFAAATHGRAAAPLACAAQIGCRSILRLSRRLAFRKIFESIFETGEQHEKDLTIRER